MTDPFPRLRELMKRMTPGPYTFRHDDTTFWVEGNREHHGAVALLYNAYPYDEADAEVIATVLNHLPALLAKEEECERYRDAYVANANVINHVRELNSRQFAPAELQQKIIVLLNQNSELRDVVLRDMDLMDAESARDEAREQLAAANEMIEKLKSKICDICGSNRLINYAPGCPRCGAPNCCDTCCKTAVLESKLDTSERQRDAATARAERLSRRLKWADNIILFVAGGRNPADIASYLEARSDELLASESPKGDAV